MTRTLVIFTTLAFFMSMTSSDRAEASDCDSGGYDGAYGDEVLLPQNWNCDQRQAFWFTDQGSEIIPYSWFLHLEQADSSEKFIHPDHIDGLRYLPQQPTALNPDGLPIGFTRGAAAADTDNGAISKAWLGMNCSACHTGQIDYGGKKYLIDGAPTMGNFEALFGGLARAMRATLGNPTKFGRFAKAVIAEELERGDGGTADPKALFEHLEYVTLIREAWNQRNRGTTPYGHARLDAFGAIFNEVAVAGLGRVDNVRSANAPVSYPFLWDTPQHDFVQWNGAVRNKKMGSIVRNVGEVLGIFGTLNVNTDHLSRIGHANSIDMKGLADLENLLVSLWSPRWEDTGLPPIDLEKASRGKVHFERHCSRCHQPIKRDDPERQVRATMWPAVNPEHPKDPRIVGTDPMMAVNFLRRMVNADRIAGQFTSYWAAFSNDQAISGEGDQTPAAVVLRHTVFGVITHALHDDPKAALDAMKSGQPPEIKALIKQLSGVIFAEPGTPGIKKFWDNFANALNESPANPDEDPNLDAATVAKSDKNKQLGACFPDGKLPCYKARSLNGIWATAPYLHNGSVRTLRQLLTPPDKRERVFKVGTRRFDPDDIGFVSAGASTISANLPGNANTGHAYGTAALAENPTDVDELLEYLKMDDSEH